MKLIDDTMNRFMGKKEEDGAGAGAGAGDESAE